MNAKSVVVSAATKKCFISIGFPENPGRPVYEKVMVVLKKNEDPIDVATKFRVRVAEELRARKNRTITAGMLYFLVFDNYVDHLPSLSSDNASKKVISLRVKDRMGV